MECVDLIGRVLSVEHGRGSTAGIDRAADHDILVIERERLREQIVALRDLDDVALVSRCHCIVGTGEIARPIEADGDGVGVGDRSGQAASKNADGERAEGFGREGDLHTDSLFKARRSDSTAIILPIYAPCKLFMEIYFTHFDRNSLF